MGKNKKKKKLYRHRYETHEIYKVYSIRVMVDSGMHFETEQEFNEFRDLVSGVINDAENMISEVLPEGCYAKIEDQPAKILKKHDEKIEAEVGTDVYPGPEEARQMIESD